MMGVVQTFAKQYQRATDHAPLTSMSSSLTYKAMASNKEQVHISIRQSGQSIKHITTHGEGGVLVENVPMGVVIVRHGSVETKRWNYCY
jgi:hypothetical protein